MKQAAGPISDYCVKEKGAVQEKELIQKFNELRITDMAQVTELHELAGDFINLEYSLPSGQVIKLWKGSEVFLGTQLCKENSDRCYGLAANAQYLLVCEYGDNGSDAEIVVLKRL